MDGDKEKKPIFNAHAHVFTHHNVPPFIARSIVKWPFYYFIHIPTFVFLYQVYLKQQSKKYRYSKKRAARKRRLLKRYIQQNPILSAILYLIRNWVVLTALYILFNWVFDLNETNSAIINYFGDLRRFLVDAHILFEQPHWFPSSLNIIFAISSLLIIKNSRKNILFILKKLAAILNIKKNEDRAELISRYIQMASFAIHNTKPGGIYSHLKAQYPAKTNFILLTMDMDYMGAGKTKKKHNYYRQLENMAILNRKKEVYPFFFVDPRRIRDKKEESVFLDYSFENGKVTLKDSVVKSYMEDEKFSGFKIYPALGYFPFDEDLLPLWKYAADNSIPIMTHGVKGVIYYRGVIGKEFNHHPVFTEGLEVGKPGEPLFFENFKNSEFQSNFTHPLNYLCLLEEPLLRKLVGEGDSKKNKELFGYTNMNTPLKHNLSKLKVCYAHYGGAEEWKKFLETDRDYYSQQLMTKPETGIPLGVNEDGEIPWVRYERLWKYTNWYSIVSSMMSQYDNFYADISYTISDTSLYPLLRSTISPGVISADLASDSSAYERINKLRTRVLFGTDFYVVRSQKSDKDIFAEIQSYLTEEEFDLIARDNPHEFISRN
jgi:predicted TIM-barrel fold metal-dependent hydrolase